jgi:Peptidase family M23
MGVFLPVRSPNRSASRACSGSEARKFGAEAGGAPRRSRRHGNGYVTAYADNSELAVKEGDAIKRGQIIAKSGDSGDVSSPRLHFELRKDGKAVDPTKYLVPL